MTCVPFFIGMNLPFLFSSHGPHSGPVAKGGLVVAFCARYPKIFVRHQTFFSPLPIIQFLCVRAHALARGFC